MVITHVIVFFMQKYVQKFCTLFCSKNTSQMLIETRIVLSYFPSGLSFIKTEETRRSPSKDFISVRYNHL